MDEQMLLKRFFDDNETCPNAMETGIAIADGWLKAQAWVSGMLSRAYVAIASFFTTRPRPV